MDNKRMNHVLDNMKDKGFSQLLITDPSAIYYLTGHNEKPGERFYGLYMNLQEDCLFFVNQMFPVGNLPGIDVIYYSDDDDVMAMVAKRMNAGGIIAVDKEMPAKFLLPLMVNVQAESFQPGSSSVDEVRGVKDVQEQVKMIDASRINDLAMEKLAKLVRPGVTEIEMAERLLEIYRDLGAEGFSFEPLIAFGANAAEPHHSSDGTVLAEGDCVLFDIGCKKDDYCADMTRTFFLGKVSQEHRTVYELVKRANEEAIKAIKPGVRLRDIDAIARTIIEEGGFGRYFTHRLGHFIGMEVHEYGNVSSGSEIIAEAGMIFSIEPGIYLEGDVGVRIEDLILVTPEGCQRLNLYSKELMVVGEA